MHVSPKFISFEGTEGVGKTTAIRGLCDYLSTQGIEYIQTREPGGSPLGEVLRRDWLLNADVKMSVDTEILAIFAARADHLDKVIIPALDRGQWVICDRFIDSTIAYQGFGRWHGDKACLDKIQLMVDNFVPILPNLTFWLDLDVKLGMQRAGKRGTLDRFEREAVAFFERTYQGFCYQYAKTPRIKRIDASGSVFDVLEQLIQTLGELDEQPINTEQSNVKQSNAKQANSENNHV